MMLRDMFAGAPQPKMPKQKNPPSTSSAQIQNSELDARKRLAGALGRGSTVIAGAGTNLGNVG